MPKVSVLMPAYNSGKYIQQSIQSILDQTFQDFELIIVNDGSTDNTHDVITSFSDDRIRYYQNEGNKGLMFVRNRLISLVNTEYIAFLDSDDYNDVNRLKIEYDILKNNNELGLVASSVYSLTEEGEIDAKKWLFNLNPIELKVNMLFLNPIVTSTVLFRKELLPDIKFRDGYPPCEDYDLWVRMLLKNKGVVMPDFLATYRLYHNSVSKRNAFDAINNRNKVILDQLEYYFTNECSKDEADLHLSLVDFSLKNSSTDLPALQNWIEKLLLLNQTYKHFDDAILKQVIFERVLKKCLRLADYNFSVISQLNEIKKILRPKLRWELRKKELLIYFLSLSKINLNIK